MSTLLLLFDLAALAAFAWWQYRNQPRSVTSLYWPALAVKLIAGLSVGMIYFYHYGGGDTTLYWRDSMIISDSLRTDPLNTLTAMMNKDNADGGSIPGLIYNTDRAFFFVKVLGVVAFLCADNYWVMSLVLSFISFFAAWYLLRIIVDCFPGSRFAAAVAFLFFPPVVFWSSGLIKESLGLAAIYFLAGIFVCLICRKKINAIEWVAAIFFVWIGWRLKYYWLAMFFLTTGSVLVVSVIRDKENKLPRYSLLLWMGVLILLLFIVSSFHPNFSPDRFFPMIMENNQAFMRLSAPGNAIEFNSLTPDLMSMVMNSPTALIAGFFRPFFWESFNLLSLISGLANLFMLLLVASAIPGLRKLSPSQNSLLVIATLFYCVMLAVFLALSTPNFGTLDRYRVGFSPFLLFLALYGNPILEKLLPDKRQAFAG
jgi:hypothetical protein